MDEEWSLEAADFYGPDIEVRVPIWLLTPGFLVSQVRIIIADLKVAMAEDDTAPSHIVEEPVREWLAKRKVRK
jgi:hypothetical protein